MGRSRTRAARENGGGARTRRGAEVVGEGTRGERSSYASRRTFVPAPAGLQVGWALAHLILSARLVRVGSSSGSNLPAPARPSPPPWSVTLSTPFKQWPRPYPQMWHDLTDRQCSHLDHIALLIMGDIQDAPKLATLPIISVEPFLHPGHAGRLSAAAALHAACSQVGFFYLDISSYVDKSEPEELTRLAREFFNLPQEEKDKISLSNEDNARGALSPQLGENNIT